MKALRNAPGKIPGAFRFLRGRHGWLVTSLCLALTLLLGCTRREPRADLVIVNNTEPGSLDPAIAVSLEELRVVTELFEGLMRYDPLTSRPIAGLAEKWEISPDGRIYTFHLRTNAVWSTGEPITADDFVYSWRRVLAPDNASEYAGQLYYVKNAEAYNNGKIKDPAEVAFRSLDPHTFQVELINPTAFFLDLCAFQTLAAAPRQAIEKYGDRWLRARPLPVSGAYQLESWRVNDKIRLRKNPRYWDAANTKSELVDMLPISTPSTCFNLYESGQVDIIWDKELVPAELLEELQKRPDYHSFTYLATYFVRLNVTHKPFDDVRVRKALSLALDKKRLIAKILKAGEPAASHLVPPGVANYDSPEGLEFDPEQARKLLAQAGYPEGKGFPSFQYLFDSSGGGGTKIHGKIAVELQQMWQETLGIKMELRQMEKKVYLDAQNKLDYDASRSSWVGDYNDPNTFLDLFLSNNGNNRTGWKNPRYDELMHQANLQTDLKMRADFLRQAEYILVHDEVPIVPIYFYLGFNYYNPGRVKGIHSNILDVHPIRDIYVSRGTQAQAALNK